MRIAGQVDRQCEMKAPDLFGRIACFVLGQVGLQDPPDASTITRSRPQVRC